MQDLSQSSVGGLELQQQRQKIQHLAEDTNAQLKKNVYMNYMQFIDTAKEISCKEFDLWIWFFLFFLFCMFIFIIIILW